MDMVNSNGSLPKNWVVRVPPKELPGMRRLYFATVIKHLNTKLNNHPVTRLNYQYYGMKGEIAIAADRDLSKTVNPPEYLTLQDYIELSPEYASYWLHIISLLRLTHDIDYEFNDLLT